LQQGRIRDALALAKLHLEKEPQSWRLLLRAAFVHLMLGEKSEATETYRRLLTLEEPAAAATASAQTPALLGNSPIAAAPPAIPTAPPPGIGIPAASMSLARARTASASAAYSLTSGSPLQRVPPFGATFPESQEIFAVRNMYTRLAMAEQTGKQLDSMTRGIVAGRPAQPGRPASPPPAPASAAQRARVSAATRQINFVPSFSTDLDAARQEATVAMWYLALQQAKADEWLAEELKAGKTDPRLLRRAVLACAVNSGSQTSYSTRLLEAMVAARPDDPLPHLIRLYASGPTNTPVAALIRQGVLRPGDALENAVPNKEQYLAGLKQSYEWLARRQPDARPDLTYYYLMRLNSVGAAAQAAEVIGAQLAAATEFDDFGALPNLIYSAGDETLMRKLLSRSAALAAEPKLPPSAAPYLSTLLEHALAAGDKYTIDPDLASLLLLLDRYLTVDDSRNPLATMNGYNTVTTSSGQVMVVQSSTGQIMSITSPSGTSPRSTSTRQQALLSQLRLYEAQLAQLRRATGTSPAQLEMMSKRYEALVGQLRQMGVEPNMFPEPNSYLDGQHFYLLERFAKLLKQHDRHGLLLERLAEGAVGHEGQERLRYKIATAFTLWWADDKASALSMLERMHKENEHDQVLGVTLAQAYFSDKNMRQALAIVERIKNADPSVAQSLERLRQEIRNRYSDLARLRDLKGHSHVVRSIAFSPDGQQLLSGSYDRSLRIWDVESGKFLKNFAGHTDLVLAAAWAPMGDRVASSSYDEIRIWDVATAACLTTIKSSGGAVRSLAFAPDGKTLASTGDDRAVRLWKVDDGSELAVLAGHTERVFSVAFSPDGKTLASAGGDKTVRLWDVASRRLRDTLTGHSASISCVAFSPDGQSLASGSDDNNVMLWRVPTGKAYATLQRHTDSVFSVAFSPDGHWLASGGADRSIKLWKVANTAEEPATLLGHTNTVASLCFAPDGQTLASGGYDELVKLWTLLGSK
jgi:WD40 repeat protein